MFTAALRQHSWTIETNYGSSRLQAQDLLLPGDSQEEIDEMGLFDVQDVPARQVSTSLFRTF